VRNYPWIGKIAECVQCVFIHRGDTKEKKTEAMQIIKERQILAEQGETPPMLIYPEGATTNGEALVYFNKGAFASLRPVQPIVLKYWTLNNIKASQDVLGIANHLNVIGMAIAVTLKVTELPVFAPNEYFWKHHWQEGKEEKWEAFARAVRQIMAEVGDFKLSDLTMQDKFDYIEKLKGR
jgi:lysophosphatidylcholine acyltransferase/lyso-PAF acetyltransferase